MFRVKTSPYNNEAMNASQNTPFPGNEQAGYASMYGDPGITNNPYMNPNRDPRFYENLAHSLSEGELKRIGSYLTDAIASDDDARQKSLSIEKTAIEYMGIGLNKGSGGTNTTAADVFGPTFLKLVISNTSKLHGNLFPASGVVDCETFGQVTQKVQDQAFRMKDFANYMLSSVMSGYIEDKKQALFWMVLCGQVFSKVCLDVSKNRPTAAYIRSDEIIINPGASSVLDAERVTHRYTLSERNVRNKFKTREWKDVFLQEYDINQNSVQKKIDNTVGVSAQADEKNKIHCFDECYCYLNVQGFEHMRANGTPTGTLLPYMVIKDKESSNIVGIWRNYNENDPLYLPIQKLVQYKYFTGPGPTGFGLAHLILGLARTETGLLQQLIRAGEFSNAPALLQGTTLKNEKSQIRLDPGSISQVATFDKKISDSFMPVPFNPPSQVLLQVLTDIISPAMSDASGAVNFSPDSMPVNATATLVSAIVSSAHILEDSIMRGLYDSFSNELKLLFNIFAEWLPFSPYPFNVAGSKQHITREDFAPNLQIKPTIDPNCSSSMKQMAIGEALLSLATQAPDQYNMREVNKFILKTLNIKDFEKMLVDEPKDPPPPPQLDFVSENARVLRGEAIQVYATQDHASHIVGHNDFIQKLTDDETADNSEAINVLQSHVNDHKADQYMADIQASMGKTLPEDTSDLPPDIQNQISVLAAEAVQQQQQQEAAENPKPVDPNEVMMEELQVKKQELELKMQKMQQDMQIEQIKMQNEKEQLQIENQIRIQEVSYKQEQLELEKLKLQLQQEEIRLKSAERMEQLRLQEQKNQLDTQTKTYDSTLKYESNKQDEDTRLEHDKYVADLDAQTKAYDSTLDYEQKSKEEDVQDTNFDEQ